MAPLELVLDCFSFLPSPSFPRTVHSSRCPSPSRNAHPHSPRGHLRPSHGLLFHRYGHCTRSVAMCTIPVSCGRRDGPKTDALAVSCLRIVICTYRFVVYTLLVAPHTLRQIFLVLGSVPEMLLDKHCPVRVPEIMETIFIKATSPDVIFSLRCQFPLELKSRFLYIIIQRKSLSVGCFTDLEQHRTFCLPPFLGQGLD